TRWRDPGGHDWSFRLWPSPMQDLALLSLEAWPPGSAAPPTPSELRAVDAVPHAAWRRLIAASAPASGDGAYWDLRAFGWPCKCLAAGSLTVLSARPPTPLGSVSFQLHPGGTVRTFPATPIWGGLLVDGAAFAVPWWLAILGMAA